MKEKTLKIPPGCRTDLDLIQILQQIFSFPPGKCPLVFLPQHATVEATKAGCGFAVRVSTTKHQVQKRPALQWRKRSNALGPGALLFSVQRLCSSCGAARREPLTHSSKPGARNGRMRFCHLCIKVKYGKSLKKVKESKSACVSALCRTRKTKAAVRPRPGCNLATALDPLPCSCVCVCVGP